MPDNRVKYKGIYRQCYLISKEQILIRLFSMWHGKPAYEALVIRFQDNLFWLQLLNIYVNEQY